MTQSTRTPDMRDCIDQCSECHETCLEAISHCLQKGGKHAEAGHIRLLQDCAQICQTSADYMIRGSEFHASTCGVCAELCEACAQSCDSLGDDPMMKQCAETCRSCADSCRRMSGHEAAA